MSAARCADAEILLVEDSETQAPAAAPYPGDERLQRLLALHGGGCPRRPEREAARPRHRRFHLPGMNGDELTRQMRLNVRTRAFR